MSNLKDIADAQAAGIRNVTEAQTREDLQQLLNFDLLSELLVANGTTDNVFRIGDMEMDIGEAQNFLNNSTDEELADFQKFMKNFYSGVLGSSAGSTHTGPKLSRPKPKDS